MNESESPVVGNRSKNWAQDDWESAYCWSCQRRQHAPANADVWDLRFRWPVEKTRWFSTVIAGEYRLSPMQVFYRHGRNWVQWSAHDALVLKWGAEKIMGQLPLNKRCYHLKGHGGMTEAIKQVFNAYLCGEWRYLYRTDIRGYYRNIIKAQVSDLMRRYIADEVCRDLCHQWLYYCVEDGGDIYTPEKGICRGSALSPLIGGSLLQHVDDYFAAREEMFYARYMDDFIFFTKTRWHLRKAIKSLHNFFGLGGFETHPDKTQLGKIDKGFDWLGT